MFKTLAAALLAFASAMQAVHAQSLFQRYEARTTRFQADQPRWIVPVIAPYPMLIQVFRADFTRQISPNQVHTWNFGTSRGLNLIPLKNTEVDILLPPFFEHGDKTLDGFGDFSVTGKYRILSGNEKHGNYMVTGQTTVSFPTGSYKNGTTDVTVTPVLSGGKGFGRFDAFTTLGGSLPAGNVKTLGRAVLSNTVFQYHAQRYIYPELEVNSTSFYGGAKDGKIQTFLSPGVVLGRYARHPQDTKNRLGIVLGAGFQIATTHYHLYNHAAVMTGRFIF